MKRIAHYFELCNGSSSDLNLSNRFPRKKTETLTYIFLFWIVGRKDMHSKQEL